MSFDTVVAGEGGKAGEVGVDKTNTNGGGGGGGVGVRATADITIEATGSVTGGMGGAQNNAGAGGGGVGVFSSAKVTVATEGSVRGGTGGGINQSLAGGGGGMGVVLLAGGELINGGAVLGGTGGTGGLLGGGGDGAAGVLLTAGGVVTNLAGGSIIGGVGGAGRYDVTSRNRGGFGGAGVKGVNVTLINAGIITGAMGGASNGSGGPVAVRAAAVEFTGGVNVLELQAGSAITGDVVAFSTADTLRLGGAADAGFDVSVIGATAQYRGFGRYEKSGASTWTLTGTTSAVTPWILTGGALSVASDDSLGDPSSGVTFNGGTLQFGADLISARAVTVTAAGGTIDTRGHINTLSGPISGAGNVTKAGAGTLILTGTNSYAGPTRIDAGMLVINGDQSAATGLMSVNSGAILGGSGIIGGSVAVADGGTLAPGNSPGTLTINGNLSLASGSVLDFELGETGVGGGLLNDLVSVGGNLVLDGTLNVTPSAGGSFGAGVYRLITYGGTLTDNGLALGTIPGSDLYVQTSVARQVNLVNTAGLTLNFWDGAASQRNDGVINGGNGRWQAGLGNDNWTEASGVVNAPVSDGSFAIFMGTGGTVSVDNSLGAVSASGMQFTANGYVIQGDGIALIGPQSTIWVASAVGGAGYTATIASSLTGATQLVKVDLGTLVLTGANSYSGGTVIDGGTVRISTDANLGNVAGGVSLDGGTLDTSATMASARNIVLAGEGTLRASAGTTFTYNGLLSGAGALTKDGAGTLLLTGDNSGYTAAAHVAGGTLAVDGTLGSAIDVRGAGRLEGNGRIASITNSGVVAPGRGGIGTLTVIGDYAGNGGRLEIEAALGGDGSSTDRLLVNGATSGTTTVTILNRGPGALTVDGIKIIEVTGASGGTFALAGDYVFEGDQAVIAGAYGYRLYKNGIADPADGDWYLRSTLLNPTTSGEPQAPLYQPGVPVYEAYAQSLLALNGLPTLQQRVGNRAWAGSGVQGDTGVWGRMEGSRQRPNAAFSTSGTDKNIDTWQMQMGLDSTLSARADGATLIGGLTAYYGKADTSVASLYGRGSIDTRGYGLGATLTWYGPQGFYVDGQAQMTWFDSDLKSNALGKLANGNDGTGKAFSLEVGKRSPVSGTLTLTPQVQMVYSRVHFDRFADPAAAVVSADKNGSLKTRWGLSIDRQTSWDSAAGDVRRSHLYGLVNLSYEWLDGTRTDVSGTPIVNRDHRLAGELGLGGSYSWGGDRFTLYSEISANTSMADFGDGYSLKGAAGLRIRF